MNVTREGLHHLIDQLPDVDIERLAALAHQLRDQGSRGRDRKAARREWITRFVSKLPPDQQSQAWGDLLWLFGEPTVKLTPEEAADLAQAHQEDNVPLDQLRSELNR